MRPKCSNCIVVEEYCTVYDKISHLSLYMSITFNYTAFFINEFSSIFTNYYKSYVLASYVVVFINSGSLTKPK